MLKEKEDKNRGPVLPDQGGVFVYRGINYSMDSAVW